MHRIMNTNECLDYWNYFKLGYKTCLFLIIDTLICFWHHLCSKLFHFSRRFRHYLLAVHYMTVGRKRIRNVQDNPSIIFHTTKLLHSDCVCNDPDGWYLDTGSRQGKLSLSLGFKVEVGTRRSISNGQRNLQRKLEGKNQAGSKIRQAAEGAHWTTWQGGRCWMAGIRTNEGTEEQVNR